MVYTDIINSHYDEMQVLSTTKNGKDIIEKSPSANEENIPDHYLTASNLVELTRPGGQVGSKSVT